MAAGVFEKCGKSRKYIYCMCWKVLCCCCLVQEALRAPADVWHCHWQYRHWQYMHWNLQGGHKHVAKGDSDGLDIDVLCPL
jgi:hypothetical protein